MSLDIRHQASLQNLNSLSLPARAEYFCQVKDTQQLVSAIYYATKNNLQITPLGGGSNMVLAGDIAGLVVHVDIKGVTTAPAAGAFIDVTFAAGENWHQMVEYCLQQGWYGLENLSLIPGNMGAAPIQNIGAYGVELCDVFVSLHAIDIASGDRVKLDHKQCGFGYRDSIFKQVYKDRYLITHVCLRLSTQPTTNISYPALAAALAGITPTPQLVSQAVCEIRRQKLPDPTNLPNVGSFFKNPIVAKSDLARLVINNEAAPSYVQSDGRYKIAAAWLIDQCGFRGQRRGPVGVHANQALVLVNYGGTGAQLMALAAEIQDAVAAKFAIDLDLEPRVYGRG
ncbi:MAG: UDP-N-acetylmuramate dehydrogenase [Porticoccaceae bacterium]|nr:UDP-N-acetylmuramate dehydrogenase [Porticoccaceae bacterium]